MENNFKNLVLLKPNVMMAIVFALILFNCSEEDLNEEVTATTVEQFTVANLNSASIQAENYDAQNGIQVVGNYKVGYINNNDWIRFEDFDFSGASSVAVRASSATNGGVIEFRAGGPNSDLLGTVTVLNTGGWNTMQTFTASIDDTSNNSDL